MKNYEEGMRCLLQAKLILNNTSKGKCDFLGFNESLADLFYKQSRYRSAIEYFTKALHEEEECDADSIRQFSLIQAHYGNIGISYSELDILDSASIFLDKALDYIRKNEHRFPQKKDYILLAKSIKYGYLAEIKRKQGEYEEAIRLHKLCIKGTEKMYKFHVVSSKFELAGIYTELGRIGEAEKILEELGTNEYFHTQNDILSQQVLWNRAMANLSNKKGDSSGAYRYSMQYILLQDSLDLLRKKNMGRDMATELRNKEQEILEEKLEREKEAKSFQLMVASILSMLAMVIGWFVWINFKRAAKRHSELEKLNYEMKVKNEEITEALEALQQVDKDTEMLVRMAAHDLRNPIGGVRNIVYTLARQQPGGDIKKGMEEMYDECSDAIDIINELVKDKT